MFKTFTLLILVIFAVQGFKHAGPEPKVGDAADEAKNLYYKLLEVVGQAITGANNTINEALDATKDYAIQVETAAKQQIQGLLDSFQAQLDEINAKAAKAGIDISECRKYEVQFSSLPDTLLDEIVKCVNDQISTAQGYANDGLNKALTIQQDFYNIETEIKNCGSGFKAIACFAKLLVKIEEDTVEGPSKIKTDADNAVTTIKNAWPEIQQCATNSVEKVPSQAANIVKDFAACAVIP